jgi:hypothetical protein
VTDIVVVKGDPSTEELAALTVALLTVAAESAGAGRRPHAGHRRPPVAGHGGAVVTACGCG